jgi:hypothetical protein
VVASYGLMMRELVGFELGGKPAKGPVRSQLFADRPVSYAPRTHSHTG